jgi:hypothetical protein
MRFTLPCSRRGAAALLVLAAACGAGEKGTDTKPAASTTTAAVTDSSGLTPFQLENGIGPITSVVTLGPVNHELAEAGEKLFTEKCSACHKMGEKYVGPALGEVTVRRTPAYVLNMILDPTGMVAKHPVAKQLFAEHLLQMPDLTLTQDQARSILEYLRTQSPKP